MATQPQAPFYAPRPSDDPAWQWAPPVGSDAMRILSFQKVFGAGGQVPTRRWAPFLVDEPAVTYQAAFQNGPVRVTLTQTQFFGQHGQVVTRRYSPFYVDEPAVTWAPAFQNGPVRVTLTQTKFFGQPGQTVTQHWQQFTTLDDPAVWRAEPRASQTIHPLLAVGPVTAQQWLHRYYDEAAPWQPLLKSGIIQQLGSGVEPFAKLWRYDWDDASPWAPALENLNSAVIQQLDFKPFTVRWRFDWDETLVTPVWGKRDNSLLQPSAATPSVGLGGSGSIEFDDAALWSPTLDNLNVPQAILKAPLPPVKFLGPFYAPNPPDIAGWQFTGVRNFNVTAQPPVKPTATAPQWNYHFDDAASWQWTPPNTITIQLVSFAIPGMIIDNTDDASVWQWAVLSSRAILATPPVPPPTPLWWRYHVDDSAVTWQQPVQRSIALPKAPFFNQRWTFNFTAAEEPWAWSAPRSIQIMPLLSTKPFTPKYWNSNEDAAIWQQIPQRNLGVLSITPKPIVPNFWEYHIDDPQGWLWTPPRTTAIIPLLFKTPIFNPWQGLTTFEEAVTWQQPHQGLVLTPFPPPVPPKITLKPWAAFILDDASVWYQQVPQRNVLYTLIPVFPGIPSLAYGVDLPVYTASALDLLGYAGLGVDIRTASVRATQSPSGQGWSGDGYMGIYEIDTQIQLNGEFRDSISGVYIDPTAITLFMLDPHGTATSFTFPGTIIRDSLGHYHQRITPAVSGTWTYKWQATGAAVATSPDITFTVNASALIAG